MVGVQIRLLLVGGLLLGSSLTLWAHEVATVLPKGISRARIVTLLTDEVRGGFDSDGRPVGLTDSLNRTMGMNDLVAAQPELGDLMNALNGVQPGLGNELLSTNLYSDFKVNARVMVPAYEYGITSRLTVGIRVPIVTKKISHDFSSDPINNAVATTKALGDLVNSNAAVKEGLEKVEAVSLDSASMIRSAFTAKGYEGPRDFESTRVGDIEMGAKYQHLKNENWKGAFTLGMRLGTGATESLTNPFDSGTGTGAYALGLVADHSYQINHRLEVGAMAKGSYSFKDTRQRAVPVNEADSLPSLLAADGQVQDVTRQIGFKFNSQLWAAYSFFGDQLEAWGAWDVQSKAQDSFQGANPGGKLRYDLLGQDTESSIQSASFGLEYSTIPLFRKKKFPVPLQVGAFYSFPVTGKNETIGPYTRMDLKLYF